MDSVPSNASLSDTHSVASLQDYQPQQITDDPSQSRKGSLVRRLSTAASSYLYSDHDNDVSDLNDTLSGTAHIYHAMSRPRDDESIASGSGYGRSRSSTLRRRSVIQEIWESDEDAEDAVEAIADAQGEPGAYKVGPKKLKFAHKYGINAMIFKAGLKLGVWDHTVDKNGFIHGVSFFKNYLLLAAAMLIILSIYWGSYYQRDKHYTKISYPIYIADEGVPEQGIPPVLGPIVENFFTNFSAIASLGTYKIANMTAFASLASSHNLSIEEEVHRQIFHERAYAAILVHKNATRAYFDNFSGNVTAIQDSLMDIVLETGRDYNAVAALVVTLMESINKAFVQYVAQTPLISTFVSQLSDSQLAQVLANNPSVITSVPNFKIVDIRPVPKVIYQAPLLIGVLYLCVFAFFQFLFMTPINEKVSKRIKGFKFIVYRFFISQIAYMIISLSYVLLNTAFGMPFNTTFGQSGFLVIWMFGYLVMSALGSVIETMVLLVVPDRIQFIGLVLIGNIVTNLAPTLAPIAFSNRFYQYGYAMPVYQAYRLMHVAYFNSWKGNVGRYVGILVAWIVVANICLPFAMLRVVRKIALMKEAAMIEAEEKKEAEEKAANAESHKNDTNEEIESDTKKDTNAKESGQEQKKQVNDAS